MKVHIQPLSGTNSGEGRVWLADGTCVRFFYDQYAPDTLELTFCGTPPDTFDEHAVCALVHKQLQYAA